MSVQSFNPPAGVSVLGFGPRTATAFRPIIRMREAQHAFHGFVNNITTDIRERDILNRYNRAVITYQETRADSAVSSLVTTTHRVNKHTGIQSVATVSDGSGLFEPVLWSNRYNFTGNLLTFNVVTDTPTLWRYEWTAAPSPPVSGWVEISFAEVDTWFNWSSRFESLITRSAFPQFPSSGIQRSIFRYDENGSVTSTTEQWNVVENTAAINNAIKPQWWTNADLSLVSGVILNNGRHGEGLVGQSVASLDPIRLGPIETAYFRASEVRHNNTFSSYRAFDNIVDGQDITFTTAGAIPFEVFASNTTQNWFNARLALTRPKPNPTCQHSTPAILPSPLFYTERINPPTFLSTDRNARWWRNMPTNIVGLEPYVPSAGCLS